MRGTVCRPIASRPCFMARRIQLVVAWAEFSVTKRNRVHPLPGPMPRAPVEGYRADELRVAAEVPGEDRPLRRPATGHPVRPREPGYDAEHAGGPAGDRAGQQGLRPAGGG